MASLKMDRLSIAPAADGGFIVWSGYDREMGGFAAPMFAGELSQCLSYIGDRFAPPGVDCECSKTRAA